MKFKTVIFISLFITALVIAEDVNDINDVNTVDVNDVNIVDINEAVIELKEKVDEFPAVKKALETERNVL